VKKRGDMAGFLKLRNYLSITISGFNKSFFRFIFCTISAVYRIKKLVMSNTTIEIDIEDAFMLLENAIIPHLSIFV